MLLNACTTLAQKDTLYYNDKWNAIDRQHASYYRAYVKQEGLYVVEDHYINGTLQMTGSYTSLDTPDIKYRNGYFTYYYPSGHVEYEGECKLGNMTGKWTYYYNSDSNVFKTLEYIDGNLNGFAVYYDSATRMMRSQGIWINDERVGQWKYYYTGTKKIKASTTHDLLVDYTKLYDSTTGAVYGEGSTDDGKKIGKWTYYFHNSKKIKSTMTYENGTLEGPVFYFDSVTNKSWCDGYYRHGRRSGLWYFFDDKGKIVEERYITNVKEVIRGTTYIYDRDSVLFFDTTNNLLGEGILMGDRKIGKWNLYNIYNRFLKYTCTYKNGTYDNERICYSVEGAVLRKEIYENGKMTKGTCYSIVGQEVPYFPLKEDPLDGLKIK